MASLNSQNETFAAQSVAKEELPWQLLPGIHPRLTQFPGRTSFGGNGIIIFRTKHGFRGVQRNCPHMQATMLQAVLTSNDTMVRCSLHAFTFRLKDGKGVNCPGFRIKVYEIKEENDALYGREAL